MTSENARLRRERNEERGLRQSANSERLQALQTVEETDRRTKSFEAQLNDLATVRSGLERQLKQGAETKNATIAEHGLLREQISTVAAERDSFNYHLLRVAFTKSRQQIVWGRETPIKERTWVRKRKGRRG